MPLFKEVLCGSAFFKFFSLLENILLKVERKILLLEGSQRNGLVNLMYAVSLRSFSQKRAMKILSSNIELYLLSFQFFSLVYLFILFF